MSGKLYSVPILGAMAHSNETRKILAPYAKIRKQSEFIRESVINFAIKKGFEPFVITSLSKPNYINYKIWQNIVQSHNKSRNTNYIYVVAFMWLQWLSKYKDYNKSKLMREIILSQ